MVEIKNYILRRKRTSRVNLGKVPTVLSPGWFTSSRCDYKAALSMVFASTWHAAKEWRLLGGCWGYSLQAVNTQRVHASLLEL
jgi:hypothetical protein